MKVNKIIKVIFIVIIVIVLIWMLTLIFLKSLPPANPNDALQKIIPRITTEDVSKGWYWGSKNQKKLGTPDNWIFCGNGSKNDMWQSSELNCGI